MKGWVAQVWRRVPRLLHIAPAAAGVLLLASCGGRRAGASSAEGSRDDAAFAASACQVLAPSDGDNHKTVFLDPGHGGPDPGSSGTTDSGTTIDEKTATLGVALQVSQMLRAHGYTVALAREGDTSVVRLQPGDTVDGGYTDSGDHRDLLARVNCANQSHADLLLSIHFNSFEDPTVGGSETIFDAVRPFATQSERFATLVQQDVVAALHGAGWDVPDRGIAADTSDDEPALTKRAAAYPYLIELGPAQSGWLDSPTQMPGALCESLFLTDPFEASIAASNHGQQVIATGMAKAVEAFFATQPATPAPRG